jgi:hypothetical protein
MPAPAAAFTLKHASSRRPHGPVEKAFDDFAAARDEFCRQAIAGNAPVLVTDTLRTVETHRTAGGLVMVRIDNAAEGYDSLALWRVGHDEPLYAEGPGAPRATRVMMHIFSGICAAERAAAAPVREAA